MNNKRNRRTPAFTTLLISSILALAACGGGGGSSSGGGGGVTPTTYDIRISWNANPDHAVNMSGGGYNVYYSNNPGFSVDDVGVTTVSVPYTETSADIGGLDAGTYYVRVAAYSTLNGGSESTASPQTSITVP